MILVRSILVRHGKRHGLAERQLRRHFVRKGCRVWRGSFLGSFNRTESVFYKYNYVLYNDLCQKMVDSVGVKRFKRICCYCRSHQGAPDFIVWDGNRLFFAEAKLENENISLRQLKTMAYLSQSFPIYVYRVFNATRQSLRRIDVHAYLKDLEKDSAAPRLSAYIKKLEHSPVVCKKWR